MAYRGWEMVDTGDPDTCRDNYPVRIYVDFDPEGEAYSFDDLAANDPRFRELMDELGHKAEELG